jgi:hypothetical protein
MARLRFNVDEVRRLVAHARAAPAHAEYFGEQLGPRLMLVKDEGIYLMSNGQPRDMVDGLPDVLGNQSFVAYAKGFDPRPPADRMDVWEKARATVGGDDFSEPLELDAISAACASPATTAILLHVTKTRIGLIVEERVPRKTPKVN